MNTLSKDPKQLLGMWKLGLFPGEGDGLQDMRKEEGSPDWPGHQSECLLPVLGAASICHRQRELHSNGENDGRLHKVFIRGLDIA